MMKIPRKIYNPWNINVYKTVWLESCKFVKNNKHNMAFYISSLIKFLVISQTVAFFSQVIRWKYLQIRLPEKILWRIVPRKLLQKYHHAKMPIARLQKESYKMGFCVNYHFWSNLEPTLTSSLDKHERLKPHKKEAHPVGTIKVEIFCMISFKSWDSCLGHSFVVLPKFYTVRKLSYLRLR